MTTVCLPNRMDSAYQPQLDGTAAPPPTRPPTPTQLALVRTAERGSDASPRASPAPEATSASGKPPPAATVPRKPPRSHHGYAERTLEHLTVDGWRPVFCQGELFVLSRGSLWEPFDKRELLRTIAELHDGRTNCIRWTDYSGIAEQATSIAADEEFFDQAPVGLACTASFYRVNDGGVVIEPLGPHHRQRVMLDFAPTESATPHFNKFLHETFRSETAGEEEEQRRLVQEIAGATLLGLMPRFQKAVLFYDPYGRAGKGTLERIISQLVPKQFTSAVSPFKWDKEYYVAKLAGSRLNVVGELPDGEPIPAASFKSVLGGDLLAGRHPTKPVFNFRNEAAHLFTSNHLISTRDHAEAFFSRWILIDFPNSLLRTGRPVDPGLLQRIIPQELPGIAHWALQGGIRLLQQDRFSASTVHDRLMQKWRRSANSIDEFIHECCELGEHLHERRSMFYAAYKDWCQESGRKPSSKQKVKDQMEHRIGLRVHFALLNGYEVIRGLAVREDYKDAMTSF